MEGSNEIGRRTVLRTIGTASALGIAGCAGNGGDSSSTTPAKNQTRNAAQSDPRESAGGTEASADESTNQSTSRKCVRPYDDDEIAFRDSIGEGKYWNTYTVSLVEIGSDVKSLELRGAADGQSVSEVGKSVTARGLTRGDVVKVVADVCGDETMDLGRYEVRGVTSGYGRVSDSTVVDVRWEDENFYVEVQSVGIRPDGVVLGGCGSRDRILQTGDSARGTSCGGDEPLQLAMAVKSGQRPTFATVDYQNAGDGAPTGTSLRFGAFASTDDVPEVGVKLVSLGEGTKGATVNGCTTAGLGFAGASVGVRDCAGDSLHVEVVPES
jgi:hypothetical protein